MKLFPKAASYSFRFALLVMLLWTLVLAGLFCWNARKLQEQSNDLALYQARAFFKEILTTRYWNAGHGGVYVPVSPDTPSNPYLEDPRRDVQTTEGLALTKVNPAYMTRQIGELALTRNDVWFHITSLKPIRPGNEPDSWEVDALKTFSEKNDEAFQLISSTPESDSPLFRYMAPLWTEKPCLTCHGKHGYKEGDLRGGISVSIKAGPLLAARKQQLNHLFVTYLLIWGLGVMGIACGTMRLKKEERTREEIILQLKQALDKVNVLSGMLPICASCKKIRDDKGYWNQIEGYIQEHSDTRFSHSLCPQCLKHLYPEFYEEGKDS